MPSKWVPEFPHRVRKKSAAAHKEPELGWDTKNLSWAGTRTSVSTVAFD